MPGPLPDDFLLTVVIPVFNEERTLVAIVHAVQAEPTRKEVILIDDGSTDSSRRILDELAKRDGVRVLVHERNLGKGAALRTGFAAARGDVVVVQDADREYDPGDYAALLTPILAGDTDVVYGSRYLVDAADPDRERDSFCHYLANRFLTFCSNLATGLNLSDMETCYKCARRETLTPLQIRSQGFAVEPELTAKLARSGARIWETPIRYRGRSFAEGKKICWRDGVAALAAILRFRFFD